MKEQNIPLFGLESQEPIKNFDFVGLTLQYEMCYTNILQILDLAQIPLLSADRGDEDPIILGGECVLIIRNRLQTFLIVFILEKGRHSMIHFKSL